MNEKIKEMKNFISKYGKESVFLEISSDQKGYIWVKKEFFSDFEAFFSNNQIILRVCKEEDLKEDGFTKEVYSQYNMFWSISIYDHFSSLDEYNNEKNIVEAFKDLDYVVYEDAGEYIKKLESKKSKGTKTIEEFIDKEVLNFLYNAGFKNIKSFYSGDFTFQFKNTFFVISFRDSGVGYRYKALNCGYCFGSNYKKEVVTIEKIKDFFQSKFYWSDVVVRYFTKEIFNEMLEVFKIFDVSNPKFKLEIKNGGYINLLINEGSSSEYPVTEEIIKINDKYETSLFEDFGQ